MNLIGLDLITLLGISFLFLWLITYIAYHCYTQSLKQEILELKSKIWDIERDALTSCARLISEKNQELKPIKQHVDVLTNEIILLFKQSEQALALGLTSFNPVVRKLAEKVAREKEL